MDFNAAVEIWLFFRQYTLSGLTTNTNEIVGPAENTISLYPNPNKGEFTLNVFCVPSQIQILNSLGQIIQSAKVDSKMKIVFTIHE